MTQPDRPFPDLRGHAVQLKWLDWFNASGTEVIGFIVTDSRDLETAFRSMWPRRREIRAML